MIYVLNLRKEWHWIGDCSQAGEGKREQTSVLLLLNFIYFYFS